MTQRRDSRDPPDRRRWQALRRGLGTLADHPRTALAIGILSVAATLITYALSSGGGSGQGTTSPGSAPKSSGDSPSYTPDPYLSTDASCDDFSASALRSPASRVLVDSPGQIAGGGGSLSARTLPNGRFHQLILTSLNEEVELSARLDNPSYSSAEGISVSLSISEERGVCWRIIATAKVRSFPGKDNPRLGPTLIRLERGESGRLEYVKSSARLLDEEGHTLAAGLSDGLTKGGLSIPYAVPGGTEYFLNWRFRVKAARIESLGPRPTSALDREIKHARPWRAKLTGRSRNSLPAAELNPSQAGFLHPMARS